MVDFEVEDKADGTDAAKEARAIKIDFDRKDIKTWFQRLEIRLEFAGVHSQWLKRLCLENILPQDVANHCKELFGKTKTEATPAAGENGIYKQCKDRLFKVYGPQPGENFKKALVFVMTGLPSEAAKDIRELVCKKQTKFDGCCCVEIVATIWKDILPTTIRTAIAHMDMTTEFDRAIENADLVYNALKAGSGQQVAAAAPTSATGAIPKTATKSASVTPKKADLDTSADAPAFDQMNQLTEQIAALNKNFKKQQKFQSGRGRGAQQKRGGRGGYQPQRDNRPHPDGPIPENACKVHKSFGKSAYYCLTPSTCPWSAHISPPS